MGRRFQIALWISLLLPAASCRARVESTPLDPAEIAFRRGDYARAQQLARNATATRQALLRALVARDRGQRDAARTEFEKLCGSAESGRLRVPGDIADAAEACQHLGRIHEGNRAFASAAEAAPKDAQVRVRWGQLFLRAHNAAEAQKLFEEALRLEPSHSGAMLGAAALLSERWDAGADKIVARIIEQDAEFVPAHLLAARIALDEEKTDAAAAHVDRALALQPNSLPGLSLRAAVAYQRGDLPAMERQVADVLKLNPAYGDVYEPIGHLAELQRQFAAAADFYKRAVALDGELWKIHSELGITLFRLGRDDDARRALEIAYKGDAFNVQTVNTLRLMDSFERFEQFETPHFRVKLHQKEAAALRPYVEELLERSLLDFAKRYKFMPKEKVSFEMFPDHEDFAVRTLGLPGLGALGASFGAIVAMDSPAARPVGAFHWGSTLWHEVAHVITLQATGNRVPRWFTEGLSVYEEHRAGWGDRMSLETIRLLQENKLMPVAELNSGFVRPRYPGQVPFAYYQAGMLCRYIAEKHGFDKIGTLLAAFRDGEKTEAALERVLGRSPSALDKEFRAWLDPQVQPLMRAIDLEWRRPRPRAELEAEISLRPHNFFARLHLARLLFKEKEHDAALKHAQAARDLFPAAVDSGSPYEIASEIHLERKQRQEAAAELQRWRKAGGMDPAVALKLAGLLNELGRGAEAAEVLEEFLYIAPLDAEIHQKLGDHFMASGKAKEAIREFGAVLALKPVDPAAAHFNLARAYASAERADEARKQVLAALEIAPGFSPAQKLLLELSSEQRSAPRPR